MLSRLLDKPSHRSFTRAALHRTAYRVTLVGCMLLAGCTTVSTYEKCGFSGCPGDREITAEVNELLALHPALEPPTLISARSLNHIVYLSGVANSDTDRRLAESVASKAHGVTRVVDSIGIDNGAGH